MTHHRHLVLRGILLAVLTIAFSALLGLVVGVNRYTIVDWAIDVCNCAIQETEK